MARTTKAIADKPNMIVETCSCRVDTTEAICPLCDRPVDTMTALGLVLVA